MELATIITANICLPTARGILRDKATDHLPDIIWQGTIPAKLFDNPVLREETERLHAGIIGLASDAPNPADRAEDSEYASPYERASLRAKNCTAPIGKPGWTQGFRFEAWLRPEAELSFLRSCCRFTQYDPAGAAMRDAWNREIDGMRMPDGRPVTVTDISTGLPREHPLERIQQMLRSLFDRLQVAERVKDHETSEAYDWRESMIAEVAPLLVAVSPVTVDPQLAERILEKKDDGLRRIATEGAWNS